MHLWAYFDDKIALDCWSSNQPSSCLWCIAGQAILQLRVIQLWVYTLTDCLWLQGSGSQQWDYAGGQGGVSQVYSFCTYAGELYCGTWPEARIFRMPRNEPHDTEWEDVTSQAPDCCL